MIEPHAALATFSELAADRLPALISYFDAGHVCRFANEHHRHWYGRTPDELVGLHMREFLGPDGYEARRPFLDRVMSGETVAFEATVPHVDGAWRESTVRYVPHLGAAGIEGFFILVLDLDRQSHRYHRVFETTVIAFWEIDLSGIHDWLKTLSGTGIDDPVAHIRNEPSFVRTALDNCRVLDVNSRAQELFGVSRLDALGSSFGRWCPPESEEHLTQNLIAYLTGEAGYEGDTLMRRADGGTFPVHLSAAFPKKQVSRPAGTFAIMDISERVARERDLAQANADLAHAARIASLGELMASIAHEVNQPLAAVVTNGNAALRWLRRAEPDLAEAQLAISRMISEGTRASEIIARTRRMATKRPDERLYAPPNAVIEEALSISRWQLSGLGAQVRLELASDLPEVLVDRVQLQQVVINLLLNAAQAMRSHPGSERVLSVSTRLEGDAIAFEVADTGPGFTAGAEEKVFNAFYTTKAEGMGMGLSVSKTIIEGHDGTIRARNNEAGGATFTFTIPCGDSDGDRLEDVPSSGRPSFSMIE